MIIIIINKNNHIFMENQDTYYGQNQRPRYEDDSSEF